MADLFDVEPASWTYRAQAADILRSTKLPIPPDRFVAEGKSAAATCPVRSSHYWALAMKGQDFRTEDRLDTDAFNAALWIGLGKGPQPVERDGEDLRSGRAALLNSSGAFPCAAESKAGDH
jgi:hypothetical protein